VISTICNRIEFCFPLPGLRICFDSPKKNSSSSSTSFSSSSSCSSTIFEPISPSKLSQFEPLLINEKDEEFPVTLPINEKDEELSPTQKTKQIVVTHSEYLSKDILTYDVEELGYQLPEIEEKDYQFSWLEDRAFQEEDKYLSARRNNFRSTSKKHMDFVIRAKKKNKQQKITDHDLCAIDSSKRHSATRTNELKYHSHISYTPQEKLNNISSTRTKTPNTTTSSSHSSRSPSSVSQADVKYEREVQKAIQQSISELQPVISLNNQQQNVTNQFLDMLNRELTPEDYELLLLLDETVAKKTCSASLIDSFVTTKISSETSEVCTVCLCGYEIEDSIKTLPCQHFFSR